MSYLPQEIVHYIIDNLASDPTATNADLSNAALISRAWRIPSQSHLHRAQLFSPPHKRLLSRLEWFHSSAGQPLVHYVKDVQFWRLDADSHQFCAYWKSVLETFPRVHDVSIQFHDVALHWEALGSTPHAPLPSFPSVTTLRLSNVAFATCHNLLALVSTLPNLTSLHMEHDSWACAALMVQGLAGRQGTVHPGLPKAICKGATCRPMRLKHLVIDCSDGLDLLECALRHVELSRLVSLNVALPSDPKTSGAGMTPLLMGIPALAKPDFPYQEEQIRSLLRGMDALGTAVFRVSPKIACESSGNPIVPRHTPRLRHFAIHFLRPDLFVPSAAHPKLHCVSIALARVVSPALATVNVTFSLSDLAQLDYLPWAEIDGILSDAGRFPVLRECAFNVAIVLRSPKAWTEKPCRSAMAVVRKAIRARLPMLAGRGMLGVHEAEDFTL